MGAALSTLLSRETLSHAISGAIASATSVSAFYPLETIRTRKQVNRGAVQSRDSSSQPILVGLARSLTHIYAKEGLRGLYRGYSAVVSSLFFSNFVYFYAYVWLKALFKTLHSKDTHRKSHVDLLVAFLAGCVNVFVTTPLWVANTRLKLQGVEDDDDDEVVRLKKNGPSTKNFVDENVNRSSPLRPSAPQRATYRGLLGTMLIIGKEEGIPALYSGTLPSLLLVLNPALQWTVYEFLKLYCQRWSGSEHLPAATYFATSALAKFCGTAATYPLQVVQTRMRLRNSFDDSSSSSTVTRILNAMVVEEGGLRGLFKGFESKIVQTVLTSAFMFVVYEKTVAFLNKHWLVPTGGGPGTL